jgi:hypothetical protein
LGFKRFYPQSAPRRSAKIAKKNGIFTIFSAFFAAFLRALGGSGLLDDTTKNGAGIPESPHRFTASTDAWNFDNWASLD